MEEAPAVALEVERLVGANAPGFVVWLICDPRARGECLLVVGIDVGDGHADVLARGAGTLGTERAVSALRADPDHAVPELDVGVVDHAVRADEARALDLVEPERALQERERRADILIRNLGNDRRSAPGLDRPPD